MGWTVHSNTTRKQRLALLCGEAQGNLNGMSYLPGLPHILHRYMESSDNATLVNKMKDPKWIYKFNATENHTPNADTKEMFLNRYGISWNAFDQHLAAISRLPLGWCRLGPLAQMLAVDFD